MTYILTTEETPSTKIDLYYGPMVVWNDGDPDIMPRHVAENYADSNMSILHEGEYEIVEEGWWGHWGPFSSNQAEGSWLGPYGTIEEARAKALEDFEGSAAEP